MQQPKLSDTALNYTLPPPEPDMVRTGDKVQLNLGCNQHPEEGFINVDLEAYPGVDVKTDLEKEWPWSDSSVDYIKAADLVEHLHDSIHTMNEAWRVLRHGGIFNIWVPSTDHRGAFQDPTHVSFWNENSFMYYVDERTNPNSLRGIYPSKIRCKYKIIELSTSIPNPFQISWVKAILEAVKD